MPLPANMLSTLVMASSLSLKGLFMKIDRMGTTMPEAMLSLMPIHYCDISQRPSSLSVYRSCSKDSCRSSSVFSALSALATARSSFLILSRRKARLSSWLGCDCFSGRTKAFPCFLTFSGYLGPFYCESRICAFMAREGKP